MKTAKTSRKTSTAKVVPLTNPKNSGVQAASKPANTRKAKAQAKSNRSLTLTHDQIAQRAKQIWERNGRLPGHDEQNWLEAERELRAELNVS